MTTTDTELVERFFRATAGATTAGRAQILGTDPTGRPVVSASTIARWKAELRDGAVRPLSEPIRVALERYLSDRELAGGDRRPAMQVIREIQEKLDELKERLGLTDAQGDQPEHPIGKIVQHVSPEDVERVTGDPTRDPGRPHRGRRRE